MLFYLFFARIGLNGGIDREEVNKIIGFHALFSNPSSKLCHIEGSNVIYHQFISEFINLIKTSSLYDQDYARHLEEYRPRPYDKIAQMDYSGLRALLTLISMGDTLSSRNDYMCQIINKGYIPKILQRLKEVTQ